MNGFRLIAHSLGMHPNGEGQVGYDMTYHITVAPEQDAEYEEENVIEKLRDHALYISYAPAEDPQIAVAVIVENGGHGSSVAAPIARKVMDAFFQEPS